MHTFLIGEGCSFRSYFAALNVPQFMALKLRIYNTSNFQQWSNIFHNALICELEGNSSIPRGSIFAFPNTIEEFKLQSSAMCHHLVWQISANVWEEPFASIFCREDKGNTLLRNVGTYLKYKTTRRCILEDRNLNIHNRAYLKSYSLFLHL
jgi:hypothetical protein